LNGAGKSTILKILGCFLTPSRGVASVDGYRVDREPDAIRRIIGYLPDTAPLYDEMSVQSYLSFVAKLKEVDDVAEAVAQAIEKTNLRDVIEARLGELSHGFRQRVGIAQAIVHNPKVLILDEPINGLDPVQIVEMRDLIVSLKGQHTVILSSHILSEITRTCDRILIIHDGKVMAEGAESELQSGVAGKSQILQLEVDGDPTTVAASLRSIAGVQSVKHVRLGGGSHTVTIEASGDVRTKAAATVVQSGLGLLGMRRDDGGLEQVFLRLINKGNANG
jgi:ABC-2 type transport system ATP-binding protein